MKYKSDFFYIFWGVFALVILYVALLWAVAGYNEAYAREKAQYQQQQQKEISELMKTLKCNCKCECGKSVVK